MRPVDSDDGSSSARVEEEAALLREEYWTCFAIPVLFWLFASLTMVMGYYGTKTAVLGPNYSHILEANSLFVSDIQVIKANNNGPVLYSFSQQPILGSRSLWSENHSVLLGAYQHQEFPLWLNKGSKLRVTCSIQSRVFYNILLTVAEGYSGLKEWVGNPTSPDSATLWRELNGQVGSLEYEAKHNGDYYVAIGNLNQEPETIELQFEVNGTVYNTDLADTKCSIGDNECKVSFPVLGKRYALLTTPTAQNGTISWEVDLKYGSRWSSYYGILALIILIMSVFLSLLSRIDRDMEEVTDPDANGESATLQQPLLPGKAGQDSSSSEANEMENEDSPTLNANYQDVKLCVICLDAPRTVFFIPCGHCATCLSCAKRLKQTGTCPICRVKIEKVRRLFYV